jgi:thioredoxin-like negative regulator of GroEL
MGGFGRLVLLLVLARFGKGGEQDDGGVVPKLSAATFKEALDGSSLLVVFYAQWCGHCTKPMAQFATAAKLSSGLGLETKLAKVDVQAEVALSEKNRIKKLPTIVLFKQNGESIQYNGDFSNQDVLQFVKRENQPLCPVVTTAEQVQAAIASSAVGVLALLPAINGAEHREVVQTSKRVAHIHSTAFVCTTDLQLFQHFQGKVGMSSVAPPSLLILKRGNLAESPLQALLLKTEGLWEASLLAKLVLQHSLALGLGDDSVVSLFSPSDAAKIFDYDHFLTYLVVFADTSAPYFAALVASVNRVCNKAAARLRCTVVPSAFKHALGHFGFGPADGQAASPDQAQEPPTLPGCAILQVMGTPSARALPRTTPIQKYVLPSTGWAGEGSLLVPGGGAAAGTGAARGVDEAAIDAFVASYFAGRAKPFVKATLPQQEQEGGQRGEGQAPPSTGVFELSAANFGNYMQDKTRDVLVNFHAPWCGHCLALEPEYAKLGRKYEGVESILISKMDMMTNDLTPEMHQRAAELVHRIGNPAVLLFGATNKAEPIQYEGKRDFEGLSKFLKQNAHVLFRLDGIDFGALSDSRDEL